MRPNSSALIINGSACLLPEVIIGFFCLVSAATNCNKTAFKLLKLVERLQYKLFQPQTDRVRL